MFCPGEPMAEEYMFLLCTCPRHLLRSHSQQLNKQLRDVWSPFRGDSVGMGNASGNLRVFALGNTFNLDSRSSVNLLHKWMMNGIKIMNTVM